MGLWVSWFHIGNLQPGSLADRLLVKDSKGHKGYKGIGLQPKNLTDRLLVKHSHPASKIETNSDKGYKVYKGGLAYSPRIWLIGC
eukprot:734991-Pelagomonas_calceolata.AAC.1